jgi:hypothetical protein
LFQSYVFLPLNSNHSKIRKRDLIANCFNSTLLAEGERATATSLGLFISNIEGYFKIIHRVPSVEGATATSLGNLSLTQKNIKINRKNAPSGLFLGFYEKTGE